MDATVDTLNKFLLMSHVFLWFPTALVCFSTGSSVGVPMEPLAGAVGGSSLGCREPKLAPKVDLSAGT